MKTTKQKRRIDRQTAEALTWAPKPFRGPCDAFCKCMRRRGAKHPDRVILASISRHSLGGRVSVKEWGGGIAVERA